MLTSWMLFPWLMAQHYIATKAMADTIRQTSLFTLFKGVYTPQVTAGYVQSGSFLAILFLEAPFFCAFFFRKATELHNRRQQLSKTDCRLCYWLTVLCDTLGSIGVVANVQIASVYLFYCGLILIVSPAYTIIEVSLKMTYTGTFLLVIFILIQTVSACFRRKCSLAGTVKGVAWLLLSLLCVTINNSLQGLKEFEDSSSDATFHAVLRSLVPSVIIGIYGYVVRKMLYQKMKKEVERAEKEDQELEPLVKKEADALS